MADGTTIEGDLYVSAMPGMPGQKHLVLQHLKPCHEDYMQKYCFAQAKWFLAPGLL